ncbi:MAG: metallophosphoesterase family protein [Candidatus Asgardarchaeia archaeon]
MGKILILSDIHANLEALNAIIDEVKNYDKILFLGDAVDYGPNPNEVIEFLRENKALWVRGNHDNAVAYGVDCHCGKKTHELSVYTRENISNKLISQENKEFLRKLSEKLILDIDGVKFYLVHAAPSNPLYEYLYPWYEEEKFLNALFERGLLNKKIPEVNVFLIGHTHYQFSKKISKYIIINPGSVGQPRDGDARASYATFDTDSHEFKLHRTRYPLEETIRKLRKLIKDKSVFSKLAAILREGKIPT